MEHTWQLVENHDPDTVKALAQELNTSPILAKLLLNRGVSEKEIARGFFIPKIEHLHDPMVMAGMNDAVSRITSAIEKDEKILVYGDYDVDGTTATSMLCRYFAEISHPAHYYIPNRLTEGYGISRQGIEHAARQDIKVIISVDCGISAVDEIELARQSGIDVIVCDHHEPGPVLPPANAVLNPKCEGCDYPFKELAGVGVAFKLLQALQRALARPQEELDKYLSLVAIGSAADIVPLTGENRVLVKLGLKYLGDDPNLGLRALIKVSGLSDQEIGTGQVVFALAPRINAVGRLGDARRAVRLLTTEDAEEAARIASVLEAENRQRREIDEATVKEAEAELVESFNPDDERVIVLSRDGWHPGVVGIVASRIVEKYHRPTVMIALEDGRGKGSARSIPGFDLFAALQSCSHLMLGFGGHKYAAGLTIEESRIPDLRQSLREYTQTHITDDMLRPRLRVDGELHFREMDTWFFRLLKKMAPFGPQNMRPVFLSRNLQVVGTPKLVGDNHLKFKVRQDNRVFDAIGFNLGELLYRLCPGESNLEMIYSVDENEWQGRTSFQLRVKDLR